MAFRVPGANLSLATARSLDDAPLPTLPPGPPYPAAELVHWAGRPFLLPTPDERLIGLFEGGPAPTPPLQNLAGAYKAWHDHPSYMDYLDPESPNHEAKRIERAIYLRAWERHLPPAPARVLDAGAGVGRWSTWFLDRGDDVWMVDPDLRSLWRAVWASVGRPGRLDAVWSTVEAMPALGPVDVACAAELLCYAEDPERAVDRLAEALRPGGLLLASVEARWGWAFAMDAPAGTVDAWLTDGVVHVPGDRWVRTFEADAFRALLERRFEVLELEPCHYGLSGAFENVVGADLDLEAALAVEARLREHPRARWLNRAWMAAAIRR